MIDCRLLTTGKRIFRLAHRKRLLPLNDQPKLLKLHTSTSKTTVLLVYNYNSLSLYFTTGPKTLPPPQPHVEN